MSIDFFFFFFSSHFAKARMSDGLSEAERYSESDNSYFFVIFLQTLLPDRPIELSICHSHLLRCFVGCNDFMI